MSFLEGRKADLRPVDGGLDLSTRELAVEEAGGYAAVHQDVADGDEGPVWTHQQRPDRPDFVGRAGAAGQAELDHAPVALTTRGGQLVVGERGDDDAWADEGGGRIARRSRRLRRPGAITSPNSSSTRAVPKAEAEAHAAEAGGGDEKAGPAEFTLLHCPNPLRPGRYLPFQERPRLRRSSRAVWWARKPAPLRWKRRADAKSPVTTGSHPASRTSRSATARAPASSLAIGTPRPRPRSACRPR